MTALAVRHDAVNLGQGFPDTDGPPSMLEAAQSAIASGVNQYPPGPGMPVLRARHRRAPRARTASTYDPDTEVLVTVGATEAIAASLLALVEAGRRGDPDRAVLRLVRRRPSLWPARHAGDRGPARGRVRPVRRSTSTRCAPPSRPARGPSWSTRRTTRPAPCSPGGAARRSPPCASSTTCWRSPTRCTSTWCSTAAAHPAGLAAGDGRADADDLRRRARRSTAPAGRSAGCAGPPSWSPPSARPSSS